MATVCCCSNPDCQVNGCAQARLQRLQYSFPPELTPAIPTPYTPPPAKPLTEEDVRRIVREEIARAQQAQGGAE